MKIKLKVVAVSSNANSFGLKSMIFISDNKQGWKACANSTKVFPQGTCFTLLDGDIQGFLSRRHFELVERLTPDPSDKLVKETFQDSNK